jgi:hypothetical protein
MTSDTFESFVEQPKIKRPAGSNVPHERIYTRSPPVFPLKLMEYSRVSEWQEGLCERRSVVLEFRFGRRGIETDANGQPGRVHQEARVWQDAVEQPAHER